MNKIISWVAIVISLIAIVVSASGLVGGNTNQFGASGTRFPNGISADSTSPSAGQVRGSTLTITGAATLNGTTFVTAGSGVFLGANLAQAATTSKEYDIAVPGVVAGDKIIISLPTTTPATNEGWKVLGASASSTSGYITVKLQNLTGGTQSIAAGGNAGSNSWGSTTQYWVYR